MKKRVSSSNRASSDLVTKRQRDSVIDEIHDKLRSSAALNGGFDTLLLKVDKIERGQGELASKVDVIHNAIYDPSDGLHAKISETKLQSTQKFASLEQKISGISEWKRTRERSDEKQDEYIENAEQKLQKIEQSVTSLAQTKTQALSGLKWITVAVIGGILTLLFKWLEVKLNIG